MAQHNRWHVPPLIGSWSATNNQPLDTIEGWYTYVANLEILVNGAVIHTVPMPYATGYVAWGHTFTLTAAAGAVLGFRFRNPSNAEIGTFSGPLPFAVAGAQRLHLNHLYNGWWPDDGYENHWFEMGLGMHRSSTSIPDMLFEDGIGGPPANTNALFFGGGL